MIKKLSEADILPFLGERPRDSHKGTYGYIALIGGSTRYNGAIRLAYMANAAMRSGAGVCKVAVPGHLCSLITPQILESTLFPLSESGGEVSFMPSEIDELISGIRTAAFGMGIGTGEGAQAILSHLLDHFNGTLIVDADGLTMLSRLDKERIRAARCDLILTPHLKEFSRLSGLDIKEIQNDPVGRSKEYALSTGTTVLLKGPETVVTDGERVITVDRGCPGMATAGSGDVLSGILAAVAAYGCVIKNGKPEKDDVMAAAVAAWINGAAGELASEEYGDICMIAGDTANAVPVVIKNLQRDPGK